MPGPLVKHRVVMVGKDRELLEVRARVLVVAGCETGLLYTMEETADALAANPKPALLLICHTSGHKWSEELRTVAEKSGVRAYFVERLTPPEQLVSDIRALLQPSDQQARRAMGSAGK